MLDAILSSMRCQCSRHYPFRSYWASVCAHALYDRALSGCFTFPHGDLGEPNIPALASAC